MIGRTDELGTLVSALQSVAGAEAVGRCAVVTGPAGIGKTALIEALDADARARGFEVLHAGGSDTQAATGFAVLHELLHLLLGRVDALPARQHRALLTAFGMTDDLDPPESLFINLAALGLIEEAAGAGPVLAVVEDLHWVDPSSAAVLDFVARRLTAAPVLLVVTTRPGHREPLAAVDALRVTLGELGDAESAELVAEVAPGLPAARQRRVIAEAGGNPLALREFAVVLEETDDAPLPARLPTSRRLEQAFLGDLAGLPPGSRALLLLAAAADVRTPLSELLAAGGDLGITPTDVDPLERNRLLAVHHDRLRFSHPLVRSAVYGAASTSERAAAHRRLATVSTDLVRSAWHRASATLMRDEAVAAELVVAASVAERRGALPEALAALERAAELTPDPGDRVHRLAAAAEVARRAGLADETAALLAEANPIAERPVDIALLAVTEGMLTMTTGAPARGLDELLSLAGRLVADSPAETAEMRTRIMSTVISRAWSVEAAPPIIDHILGALRSLDADPGNWALTAGLTLLDPVGQAPAVRPLLPAVLEMVIGAALVDERETEPGASQWLGLLGRTAESVHDLATAAAAWEPYLRFHRAAGSLSDVATALQARSVLTVITGDLRGALADSRQAYELGLATHSPRTAAAAAAVNGLIHAFSGDHRAAVASVRESAELRGHQPHSLVSSRADWAAGLVSAAENRYGDAWLELGRVSVHPTTGRWVVADLAEAGLRSGHAGQARALVDKAEEEAKAFDAPVIWAVVHRARAVLAEGDEVEGHLSDAVVSARQAGAALEGARSELALGEWLRRQRRITEAREHLGAAQRTFEEIGAAGFAGRAAAELRAAGVTASRGGGRAADPTAELTAQELQIVRLAATGLSNREIADQVYISHRTVATHLYKAFPKLGISNRAQLAGLFTPVSR